MEGICQRYGIPLLAVDILAWLTAAVAVIALVLLIVLFFVYLERKVRRRFAPTWAGTAYLSAIREGIGKEFLGHLQNYVF